MKNDSLYSLFLIYLETKLVENKITKGQYSLLKMSKQKFEEFKYKYENDELFNKKLIEIQKSEIRDQKIDDIFDDID